MAALWKERLRESTLTENYLVLSRQVLQPEAKCGVTPTENLESWSQRYWTIRRSLIEHSTMHKQQSLHDKPELSVMGFLLLEVTLDFLNRPGEVEGEPQATLSLQEQPIDINPSWWCIQRRGSPQQANIPAACPPWKQHHYLLHKKHICNQTYPLKSEDTSAFDLTELAGGILTLVRNNIDAIQTTPHMDDSEFQVMNLKKKDFHVKLVNLYSPNDKALSLNALPLPCCWRLQQSFTELGIWPHRKERERSRELAGWP